MITSQALSRVLGWILISLILIVLFSAVAWEFWRDAPTVIIALGVWIVSVVVLWIWLWHATENCQSDSRSDVRRKAALRAVPLAVSFAPTFVALGPMFAFPFPASLALPLLVAHGFFADELLWNWFYQIVFAATSLCTVWLVCFFVICRGRLKQSSRPRLNPLYSKGGVLDRLKPPQSERSTYEY